MTNSKNKDSAKITKMHFGLLQMFERYNNICCLLMTVEHGLTKAVWSMSPH